MYMNNWNNFYNFQLKFSRKIDIANLGKDDS